MHVQILKSKLHRARLTDCHLNYEGSLAIDRELMDAVGMFPGEKLLVVNQTNGERLETYAIPADRGTRTFCLNGAAARRGEPGDMITVMAFGVVSHTEAADTRARVLVLDEHNEPERES